MTAGPPVVWWLRVAEAAGKLGDGEHILDAAERERAGRFADKASARRFAAARAALRLLLAEALGTSPRALHLVETAEGRPCLAGGEVAFSVSHSADLALIALVHGPRGIPCRARIGVDVEALRAVPDALAIARQLFAPGLVLRLDALPAPERCAAFLAAWTGLEALAKATGRRLDEGRLDEGMEALETGLAVVPLALPAGYVGSLATDQPAIPQLRSFPVARLAAPLQAASLEAAS